MISANVCGPKNAGGQFPIGGLAPAGRTERLRGNDTSTTTANNRAFIMAFPLRAIERCEPPTVLREVIVRGT